MNAAGDLCRIDRTGEGRGGIRRSAILTVNLELHRGHCHVICRGRGEAHHSRYARTVSRSRKVDRWRSGIATTVIRRNKSNGLGSRFVIAKVASDSCDEVVRVAQQRRIPIQKCREQK